MLVTLPGIVMLVNLNWKKALSPMLVTLLGIVTLVKLVHLLTAEFPMLVTVFGMM